MKITKKLAISSALIASLILSPVAVFADGTATQTTTEANQDIKVGMTPDSFFYFFKQLIRDMNLYYANDNKEKAQLLLQYANEKAAELKVLNEAEKTKYNQEQMQEIEAMITEANTLIGDGDAEQADDTVTTEPTTPAPTTSETTAQPADQQPQDNAAISTEQAVQVLKTLLDKLPEQDRKGVEQALEKLVKNLEKKLKKVEEKAKSQPAAPATTEASTTAATSTAPATTTTTTASEATVVTNSTPEPAPAPVTPAAPAPAPAPVPLNPEVKVQVKAPAPVITKKHDDDDEKEHKKEKEKEHKKENHNEHGNHENNQHGNHNGDN